MEEVFDFLDNEESSDEDVDIDAEQLALELEEEECLPSKGASVFSNTYLINQLNGVLSCGFYAKQILGTPSSTLYTLARRIALVEVYR